jgi:hypothetical protein
MIWGFVPQPNLRNLLFTARFGLRFQLRPNKSLEAQRVQRIFFSFVAEMPDKINPLQPPRFCGE